MAAARASSSLMPLTCLALLAIRGLPGVLPRPAWRLRAAAAAGEGLLLTLDAAALGRKGPVKKSVILD